jgi:hypothetical protein
MDEIIPGYNEYKESLFDKMMEPLNDYILCKLKIDQLKRRGNYHPTKEAIDQQMMAAKDRIAEILIQEKDLTWIPRAKL